MDIGAIELYRPRKQTALRRNGVRDDNTDDGWDIAEDLDRLQRGEI